MIYLISGLVVLAIVYTVVRLCQWVEREDIRERTATVPTATYERLNPKRVFLCGPMTGKPDFNYCEFNRVAALLRAKGYEVLNPAENPEQSTYEGYLRLSFAQLVHADSVALLEGWDESKGAGRETQIAEWLGIECWDWEHYL